MILFRWLCIRIDGLSRSLIGLWFPLGFAGSKPEIVGSVRALRITDVKVCLFKV